MFGLAAKQQEFMSFLFFGKFQSVVSKQRVVRGVFNKIRTTFDVTERDVEGRIFKSCSFAIEVDAMKKIFRKGYYAKRYVQSHTFD